MLLCTQPQPFPAIRNGFKVGMRLEGRALFGCSCGPADGNAESLTFFGEDPKLRATAARPVAVAVLLSSPEPVE